MGLRVELISAENLSESQIEEFVIIQVRNSSKHSLCF